MKQNLRNTIFNILMIAVSIILIAVVTHFTKDLSIKSIMILIFVYYPCISFILGIVSNKLKINKIVMLISVPIVYIANMIINFDSTGFAYIPFYFGFAAVAIFYKK
ncbi:hypothetical protein [Clostridium sp. JN-1]|uniref:hypothetical protein n=1 Tax=Clostridium sp. JN-1 TaxID=2483110 RepID=UPI000F0B8B14|nr:hypothetical protein [Clostridium sp. JN-1]